MTGLHFWLLKNQAQCVYTFTDRLLARSGEYVSIGESGGQ